MIKWIILNRCMSSNRKLYKLCVYLWIRFVVSVLGREVTLLALLYGTDEGCYTQLFHNVERLVKKGYKVRVDISTIGKNILIQHSDVLEILSQLENQQEQCKL